MALDDGTEIARLMRRYHAILVSQAADAASTTVGVDIAFDLEMEEVQAVLDHLAKQVRNVADTTRQTVRELAGQAAREGWSPQDYADRLVQSGLFGPERAMLISRTETASAYSRGSVLAYRQSGVVAGTEWLVTDPCPICEPLAGKIAPLGEAFTEDIEHPPAHPNCRCAIAPILKDVDEPDATPEVAPEAQPTLDLADTVTSTTVGRSTIYELPGVPDAELQIVKRTDGRRAVATFLVPESERGKGYGGAMLTAGLKDGDVATESFGGVSDAYRATQRSLVRRGIAEILEDEFGETFMRLTDAARAYLESLR